MADQTAALAWGVEEIPDSSALFYRVHVTRLAEGRLTAGIFFEQEGSMSVEWERYATAVDAHGRSKVPSKNGIVALIAGDVRSVPGLAVRHAPLPEVRAHSDVLGLENPVGATGEEEWVGLKARERKVKIRERLFALCSGWVIEPPSLRGG
jgi:hypothetical protein